MFAIAAIVCIGGALGVILARNPVHAALSLVATLFGIAIHFVNLGAHFLAAVQVVFYAGAIVVLFLFVIMLLGVDKVEDLETESLAGQRPAAAVVGVAAVTLLSLLSIRGAQVSNGLHHVTGSLHETGETNITQLGKALFTDYVFAFELTSALLVIAVVGAVVLARRGPRDSEVDA